MAEHPLDWNTNRYSVGERLLNWTFPVWRWVMPWWWHYLLDDTRSWSHVWCRLRGHPNGAVFYNPGGFEPDEQCWDCPDYIGGYPKRPLREIR